MSSLLQIQDWLGTALAGAVLAALGYVLKLFIELYQSYKERQRTKRAKLIELQSLLRATKFAFLIQNKHAATLTNWIETNLQNVPQKTMGYEAVISGAFDNLPVEQKELHSIIRSITTSTLYPTNKLILEWLREDTVFKTTRSNNPQFSDLAASLLALETHLVLWLAKYDAWIPGKPAHALVYMADEREHGFGFPNGVDESVENVLKRY